MKVSDYRLQLELMKHGSVLTTAKALGVDASTIYKRLKDNQFRAELIDMKNDTVRWYRAQYLASAEQAKKTIESIMLDGDVNPAVRLQASQTMINTAVKFVELADKAEDRAVKAREYEREHRKDEEEDAIDELCRLPL